MKVEHKEDHSEMPEACEYCGTSNTQLGRFYYYGPGHNVEWLCRYCRLDSTNGRDPAIKSIAAMINELDRHLTRRCIGHRKQCR